MASADDHSAAINALAFKFQVEIEAAVVGMPFGYAPLVAAKITSSLVTLHNAEMDFPTKEEEARRIECILRLCLPRGWEMRK